MLHLFSQKHALKKAAKNVLQGAERVKLYRGDLLKAADIDLITATEKKLIDALNAKPFDFESVDLLVDELHVILVKTGGKIYPVSGFADYVEMVVMAAIVAGSIRSFCLQPFKIPTNSMWPTYNGMTADVRQPNDPVPSLLTRSLNKLQWTWTYVVHAESSGEIKIPLKFLGYDNGIKRYSLRQRTPGADSQEIVVGTRVQSVSIPTDFNLDGVLLRTLFADDAVLPLRRQDHDRWEKVLTTAILENRIEETSAGPMLRTGRRVQSGDVILNFDILTGDMLFVDRISYHFVEPTRGDTIVFRTNHIPGLADRYGMPSQNYYVKRLAGIPGDQLRVDNDGKLWVNGSVVDKPMPMVLNSKRDAKLGYFGYIADIGDYSYSIPLTKNYTVTDNHYYALGDNSANSFDSRGWGEVPAEDVVGSPLVILHPFTARWGWAK